jgi:imidazolonepropionase-like amidohydrolase
LSVKVIQGGKLVDGTGADPISDSAVVIDGKTIAAVGKRGRVKVPGGAEVIDASGKTVMPGLIESHNHPLGERDFSDPGFKKYYDNLVTSPALGLLKGVQVIQRLLTLGITTVRIPHPTIPNAPELRGEWLVALRTAVERGYFPAPRVVAGGCVLPTGGHLNSLAPPFVQNPGWKGADGPWEVRKQTRECLTYEVDFIKLIGPGHKRFRRGEGPEHTCMTREEVEAAVEEAHWRGVPVAAHVKNGPGLRFAVEGGVDSIEHGTHLFEQPDLIRAMVKNGQILVPTMGMFFEPKLIEELEKGEPGAGRSFAMEQDMNRKNFKACHEAGVKIAAGTDNTFWEVPGLAWEIHTYVREGGMTEMEAILSATKNGAEVCALGHVGTLEPGKTSDLVIVDGDPLKDIAILQDRTKIEVVIKEGNIVARKGVLLYS